MTKIKDQRPKTIFIFIFIAVAYFMGLGALPLIGPDEPRYAQVAREMFERGDFVTPTLGGFHWFEKPALLYWLMIAAYKLFGVSEFSARAGSALFGLLTILTIYLLCRLVEKSELPENIPASPLLSLTASLIAASSIGLLVFSYAATFDIILTFPVTAALACFFKFKVQSSKFKVLSLVGFYFFVGIALLAKGLIGAVLPFGIVFSYFVATQRLPNKKFLFSLVWGFLIILAVAAVWYLPMYLRHGWEFIDEFFIQHHFARYTSNKYQHPEPFWFFWAILPGFTLPWLPFFAVAVWKIRTWNWRKPETTLDFLRIFAFCWMVLPVVFFSFSGSKLPGYILPALPAALVLTAEQVWRFAKNNQKRVLFLTILACACLIIAQISLRTFGFEWAQHDTMKTLIQEANQAGFGREKVYCFIEIPHSLEFYAPNRLVRTEEGKQRQFIAVSEIAEKMRQNGEQTALVVTPPRFEYLFKETDLVESKKLADNGALTLFVVKIR